MFDLPPPDTATIQTDCTYSSKQFLSLQDKSYKHNLNNDRANDLRLKGIFTEGKISGAKQGVFERYKKIDTIIKSDKVESVLDQIFSFQGIIYDNNIIPPVIQEINGSLDLSNDKKSAVSTGKSWKILEPARLTTGVITWRTYLYLEFLTFQKQRHISGFYYPVGSIENTLWLEGYCAGFKEGHKQANALFMTQLAKLRRDYLGMALFVQLEKQGVVSAPKIKETRLGIIVNDKEVLIDKRDVRITSSGKFKPNKSWEKALVK